MNGASRIVLYRIHFIHRIITPCELIFIYYHIFVNPEFVYILLCNSEEMDTKTYHICRARPQMSGEGVGNER